MFLYLQFQIEKLKIEEWPEMVNNLKNSGPHSQFVAFDMQCLHYYHNYHYHYYWISLLLNVIIIWHPVPACSSKLSKSFFKMKTGKMQSHPVLLVGLVIEHISAFYWAHYWGYFCLSLNIFLRYFCLLFSTLLSIFLLVEHIIEYISSCYWACGQFPRQLSLLISIVLKSTRSENARVNNFNFYLHFFVLKNRKAIIINNLWKTYNYDNP